MISKFFTTKGLLYITLFMAVALIFLFQKNRTLDLQLRHANKELKLTESSLQRCTVILAERVEQAATIKKLTDQSEVDNEVPDEYRGSSATDFDDSILRGYE